MPGRVPEKSCSRETISEGVGRVGENHKGHGSPGSTVAKVPEGARAGSYLEPEDGLVCK